MSDDRLEEYCLGRVPATELDEIEDHLLICPACQARLRDADQYVRTIRQAITALASEPEEPQSTWSRLFAWLMRPMPILACTTAAAAVLVLAMAPQFNWSGNSQGVSLRLEALRGESATLRAKAPERTPLELTLDLTGIRQADSYRVKVVDAAGHPVSEGTVRTRNGGLRYQTPPRLSRGLYWIRLYDQGVLVREYGMELQ